MKNEIKIIDKDEIAEMDQKTGLESMRRETTAALREYDRLNREINKDASSLEDTWRQVCRIQDTNEMVRSNLHQLQVLFQKVYCDMMVQQVQAETELNILENDKSPEGLKYYLAVYKVKRSEWMQNIAIIQEMAKTCTALSAEYNKTQMTRKFFLHISVVEQLKALFIASIHAEIHDNNTLARISSKLSEGYRKFFPNMTEHT